MPPIMGTAAPAPATAQAVWLHPIKNNAIMMVDGNPAINPTDCVPRLSAAIVTKVIHRLPAMNDNVSFAANTPSIG